MKRRRVVPLGSMVLRWKGLVLVAQIWSDFRLWDLRIQVAGRHGSFRFFESREAEIAKARRMMAGDWEGFARLSRAEQKVIREFWEQTLRGIFERYTKRMHNLSVFMKGLLQRFTRWFNKENGLGGRSGRSVFSR